MRQCTALIQRKFKQFFQAFFSFIVAFLKNRRPLGSLTVYSLVQRGRMFCLVMAANRNTLHKNYSMEYISETMELRTIQLLTLNTSIVSLVKGNLNGQGGPTGSPHPVPHVTRCMHFLKLY